VGKGSLGANLGGIFWSKDKGAKGVSEDANGIPEHAPDYRSFNCSCRDG